jgi:hypothetical protein
VGILSHDLQSALHKLQGFSHRINESVLCPFERFRAFGFVRILEVVGVFRVAHGVVDGHPGILTMMMLQ